MRINTNTQLFAQRGNLNLTPTNQAHNLLNPAQAQGRTDRVSFSASSKANSLLESLAKQKQNIQESKEKLISSTLEGGGSIDQIQEQIETYDKMMKDLDAQIKQSMTDQAAKEPEKKKAQENSEPKTEEQIQSEKLGNLMDLTTSIDQLDTISSTKAKLDGEIRSLKAEVKMDQISGGSLASKSEEIAELEGRSKSLSKEIADGLIETNETIQEKNEAAIADEANKKEEPENGGAPVQTDASLYTEEAEKDQEI